MIVILLLLIALAGCGVMAYLWMGEKNNNLTLTNQVSSLNQQLTEVSKGKETPATNAYTATVGKFTLTLPSTYPIILNWDGGYEGGPVTALEIGKQSNDPKVVSYKYNEEVSIWAVPKSTQNASFAEWVNSRLDATGAENEKKPSIKMDGVTAEVYQINGLTSTQKVFFTQNSIYYEITVGDATEASMAQTIFDEVVKGFKFSS